MSALARKLVVNFGPKSPSVTWWWRMNATSSQVKMDGGKIPADQTPPPPLAVRKEFKKAPQKPLDLLKQPVETPKLDKFSCGRIETVTSIDVSNKLIAWITVTKNGDVTDWNFAQMDAADGRPDELSTSNNSIQGDYKKIWEIYQTSLPKNSSAYLFETRRYKAIDVRIVPFLMRIHRSEVILQSIYETKLRLDQLKSLDGLSSEPSAKPPFQQVYSINSRRVAQSLDIFVGNERINSTNMVDELIKYKMATKPTATAKTTTTDPALPEPTSTEQYKQGLKERYALNVPVDLMGFYLVKLGEESKFKEAMAKCYVQATCFLNSMRLVQSAAANEQNS